MKKTALTLITGLAIAASAQAGETYSSKAPAPMPPPAPCGWSWFAGGSVGYLTDMDTEMYTLHVGKEYKCERSSHAIFLEVGYANTDGYGFSTSQVNPTNQATKFDVDTDIIPITLNYKYELDLTENLGWYIGAGAGVALVDANHSFKGNTGDIWDRASSSSEFFGQIFTGLVYNVSDAFELFGGARYLYINDDKDFDTYGDDWMFELGARWNF